MRNLWSAIICMIWTINLDLYTQIIPTMKNQVISNTFTHASNGCKKYIIFSRRKQITIDAWIKVLGITYFYVVGLIWVYRSRLMVQIMHIMAHNEVLTMPCAMSKVFNTESFPFKYDYTTSECKIHSVEVDLHYFK